MIEITKNLYDECVELLNSRGVTLLDIANCVLLLQREYHDNLTVEECLNEVKCVLRKREVQHVIMTGISLDIACEKDVLESKTIEEIMSKDYSLYGVDEVMAYGICNLYGSIALTNFGYIDKIKPGIIEELNNSEEKCNTFLDDIVGALAAAAASRLAHNSR